MIEQFALNDAFGVAAFAVIMISEWLYVRSMFVADPRTGARTRPSRSTYWIWTAVQGTMAASYIASGEVFAAGLSVAYALAFLVVAFLSIKHGYSAWGRTDTWCLWAVVLALVLWIVSGNPLIALVASIGADFIGAIPTLKKSWVDPASESRIAWMLTVFACLLNFAAVREWGVADAVYTPYLLVVNVLITYAVWVPRRADVS